MARGIRGTTLALVVAAVAVLPVSPSRAAVPEQPRAGLRAELRVDQHGWLPHETKLVTLMASRPLGRTTFTVVDGHRSVVLRGTVPSTPAGAWSGRFPAVYRLDLSALHQKGRY